MYYAGLEPQIVSHTVEVTTCYLISKQDPQGFSHLVSKLHIKSLKYSICIVALQDICQLLQVATGKSLLRYGMYG